jgi:hypothetical protein
MPPHSSRIFLVYAINYGASLCSLQWGGCGRCLACDRPYQPPTDACWAFGSCCRVLQLLSPAPRRSVRTAGRRRRHNTIYVREAPKRASGSTWLVRQGISQLEIGLSSCVLVAISPRRAKLGGVPRGVRSADTPPPTPTAGAPPPAAGPVAGAGLAVFALQRPVGSRSHCGFREID